ncbi:hypothetical protein LCGC14_1101390 [marine sediment metagenome]|uniref:DksA C4-type domain-containing protein n=1 Tax=marine sediment metagenome TaxID=412755 RepID=A0A0F9PSL7_9ZZZZ|nr:MAG: hypothetical protein Lokiarch_31670 [Candidatus Lokiarchaeum sp. GC14_75]
MKRKRVIRIKDPHLQKIRNNLRGLILDAASEKMSQLRELDTYYEHLGEKEKAHEVTKEVQEILVALKKSICMCEVCGTTKEDMIYVPKYKSWFCIACAKMNRVSIP